MAFANFDASQEAVNNFHTSSIRTSESIEFFTSNFGPFMCSALSLSIMMCGTLSDALLDKIVEISLGFVGTFEGFEIDGSLLVETDGGIYVKIRLFPS